MKYGNRTTHVRRSIGRKIRDLRLEQGYSQSSLATMVAINRSYLCEVENGRRNISLDNLIKISDALDVPLPILFEDVSSTHRVFGGDAPSIRRRNRPRKDSR